MMRVIDLERSEIKTKRRGSSGKYWHRVRGRQDRGKRQGKERRNRNIRRNSIELDSFLSQYRRHRRHRRHRYGII